MFIPNSQTQDLKNHLLKSPTVSTKFSVIAEWNLNLVENIEEIGNYRYRPNITSPTQANFGVVKSNWAAETQTSSTKYYYGATDADITIDGGYDEEQQPISIISPNLRNKFYYSLEDCFNRFRPRSGINKAVFAGENNKKIKFGHFLTSNLAQRPRYYVANKKDLFKYWTSYRTEAVAGSSTPNYRGYSNTSVAGGNGYNIDDCVPFVVYKEQFAANRIIIKMQTHVGAATTPVTPNDPFTGEASVPKNWKIDTLDSSNNWNTIITLNNYTIPQDGYVELVYGLVIPSQYQESFVHAGEYSSSTYLPDTSVNGYSYLVGSTYYIWQDSTSNYQTFSATVSWQINENLLDRVKPYVTDFISSSTLLNAYQMIKGIRIVVSTMKRQYTSFDLIEISPRLCADISDRTISFNVDKKSGDLSAAGIPSGEILASTGEISVFDYDQAFDKDNKNSIISTASFKNLQFKFYQKILDVNGIDYVVPIKTMYVDGFPESNYSDRTITMSLRDLLFYFESTTCPPIFLRNKTLKHIIVLLMDSIGFSNYDFKYVSNERDVKIPNFYVGPDKSVAEVLQDLAQSTQTSMFFDESNNFIVMSKKYILPESSSVRATDITLSGSSDQIKNGVYSNITNSTGNVISNIIEINSENHEIYNDGKIVFSNKYIQKNVSELDAVGRLDYEKTYTYQPVLLWELAANNKNENLEETTSSNSSYVLSAIPLETNISMTPPSIANNAVVNNTINVGEMVYWLNNYSGYLLANGEIIRYDAKQYTLTGIEGNVWISNESDREYYFSKVPYMGQMKPTGVVRIYTEVSYDSNGNLDKIVKHGRAQFGTKITSHNAGLNDSWKTNIGGAVMDFEYLNGKKKFADAGTLYNPGNASLTLLGSTTTLNLPAGKGVPTSTSLGIPNYYEDLEFSSINGIISNYLSSSYQSQITYTNPTSKAMGKVQASALVFTGTKDYNRTVPLNFISYTYKTLEKPPTKVGARVRIMGKQTTTANMSQMPFGEMTYLGNEQVTVNDKAEVLNISGASGGIGIYVNPKTNAGYYFEIAALSSYLSDNDANVWFYKLTRKEYPSFIDNSSAKLQAEKTPDNPNKLIASSNQSLNAGNRVKSRTSGSVVTNIAVGDRILVENVSEEYQKGYFKVNKVGSASEPWELERDELAIPKLLFQAKTDVLVDYTSMVGTSRITPGENLPIYDLRVEVKEENNSLAFYLYINDTYIGFALDEDSGVKENKYSSVALFQRGTSKCMFEHVYAVSPNATLNNTNTLAIDKAINNLANGTKTEAGTTSTNINKYGLPEEILSSYLSNIKQVGPSNDIFYDEFGTILRECAYFNIRYDKAYPALLAKVADNYNPLLGYYVSNFTPTPYGAEFMVFNRTDAPLVMDSSNGNYLRINGVTFTAESNEELTVDEYFDSISDYSQYSSSNLPRNTSDVRNDLTLIKNSRTTYGKKEFAIEAPYIQDRDTAYEMMGWMIQKIKKQKLAVSLELFAMPIIQLGDIVQIDYQSNNNRDIPSSTRFVVYCINHSVNEGDISQTVYLSEVV
jgi:hypothetical protein